MEFSTVKFSLRALAGGAALLALAGAGGALAQTPAPAPAPSAGAATAPAAAPTADAPAAAPTADAPAEPAGPQPLREQVAATVNDEIISTYDLRQRVRLLIISSGVQVNEQNLPEIEREALRGLVDERLQRQDIATVEARQKDIKLYPEAKEVDEEVATYAKQFNVTPKQLIASLKNAGVDEKTLRDQISIAIAWRRYIGGRFRDNVHVSDTQVAATLDRVKATASQPQYLLSEVFIDAARAGGQPQAVQGATQLVQQIRGGAPFGAVARQFSSLATAANGGDAGWLSEAEVPAALRPAVVKLRSGAVSDPIPVQDGVYIVALRDKRSGAGVTTLTLKQAAIRLAPDAPADQVTAATAKLVALRDGAGGCDQLPAAAAKVSGVIAGDLGAVNPDNLSPEFKSAVEGLKPGQIGGPVRTKAGLHILALCARQTGAGAAPSRADIENRMYGEQLSMIERRYLRDLRNSAAIDTR